MANSLSIQGSILFQSPAGSNLVQVQPNISASAAPIGNTASGQTYTATTTQTEVTTPGVTSLGYVFFRNLDPTNFVQIGHSTGAYCLQLLPGDISIAKWNGNNIFVLANTANVQVQIIAFSL
jgi:hypothetical protein